MDAPPGVRGRQRLACMGLVCITVFVLALLVLHATAQGRLPSHMSQFANSPYGLFWALALYCLIVGTAVLVWALGPCLHAGLSKRIGMGMLVLAGIGGLLVATFPTDAVRPVTWRGTLHDDAAATTFSLLAGAMVVLTPALRSSPLQPFARPSFALGVLCGLTFAAYLVATFNDLAGLALAQRLLVAFILVWFVLLAVRLWRMRDPFPQETRTSRSRRKPARQPSAALQRVASSRGRTAKAHA